MKTTLHLRTSLVRLFILSLLVLPLSVFAQLSGTYTINSGAATAGNNFASFTDLATALNGSGVNGPVTVNVAAGSGPYNERFLLGAVSGSSSTNTITINGSGETIAFSYTSGNDFGTLTFNGTSYVSIDNLTIQNSDGSGISFAYNCYHFQISNCTITSSGYYGSGYGVLAWSDPLWNGSAIMPISDLTISNTYINTYGGYGIDIDGLDLCTGVNLTANNIIGGVIIGGSLAVNVVDNDIDATGAYDGIRVWRQSTGVTAAQVTNNKVKGSGISISANGSAQSPILIANNAVYEYTGDHYIMGISVDGENVHAVNNSISMSTTGWWTGHVYGIYAQAWKVNTVIKNNNIHLNNQSTGIFTIGLQYEPYYGFSPTFVSDNNNVFISNPNGYCHYMHIPGVSYYTTLSSWQAAYSGAYDQNSQNLDPAFANPSAGDLTPTNFLLDNLGTPVSSVTTDITGAARNATTPDIGAWEFGGSTIVWYLDADGDGWYVQTQTASSSPGNGWTSTTPTGGSSDCDDADNTIWQAGNLFVDADSDNWAGNGGITVIMCYGNAAPAGYSFVTIGTDCDDQNANVTSAPTWYLDADNDGYYVQVQSACSSPGAGWNTTGGNSGDCDDNDPGVWQGQTWYEDADSDGHYVNTQYSCGSPGTGWNTTGGGNGDCNDGDASVWQSGSFYVDADGDGYDAGQATVCYGASIPSGYATITNGPDCNDANPNSWQGQTWYLDADNDGHYVNTQYSCGSPGTGWNTTGGGNGDCNEGDAGIHPGATEICGNGIDEDCNGSDLSCGGGNCNATINIVPGSLDPVWVSSGANDPNVFYYGLARWKTLETYVQGGVGPYSYSYTTNTGQLMQQNGGEITLWDPQVDIVVDVTVLDAGTGCTYTQSINIFLDMQYFCYKSGNAWFIKICRNGETVCRPWSAARSMVLQNLGTLGACPSARKSETPSQLEMQLEVYPNPNQGAFNILITDGTDGMLEILDMNGRQISAEPKSAAYGVVEHQFDLSHLMQGIYMLRYTSKEDVIIRKFVIQH